MILVPGYGTITGQETSPYPAGRCQLARTVGDRAPQAGPPPAADKRVLVGIVDLQLGFGVGDEDDRQPGPLRRAGVLGQDVVGTRFLDPVVALMERGDGLMVELAPDGAFEDVRVDEGVAVPVRQTGRSWDGRCSGRRGRAVLVADDAQDAADVLCGDHTRAEQEQVRRRWL